MTHSTPHTPGRETSGHTGAGLIGSLDTGLEAGPEGQALKDDARERDARAEQSGHDHATDALARDPGEGDGADLGRLAGNARGGDAVPPGASDVSGPGQLAGSSGGERGVAGINDADRSSRDHGNSLQD